MQEETGYLPTGLSEEDSYTVVGLFTFLFFNVLSRNWWLRLSVMLPDFSENCPYVCACGMHHLRLLLVDAHHVVCLITSGKFVPLFWSSFADACAPPPPPQRLPFKITGGRGRAALQNVLSPGRASRLPVRAARAERNQPRGIFPFRRRPQVKTTAQPWKKLG